MANSQEKVLELLNAKIPRDVISQREGGGGRKLSYLEGWYVIDRLNEIFGQGNWAYSHTLKTLDVPSELNGKFYAAYLAEVRLVLKFPDGTPTEFTDIGFGDGKDNSPGKAHESAAKEAVTDGIKRCAKNLGSSMGLALYDKTQENVDDGEEQEETPASTKQAASSRTSEAPRMGGVHEESAPAGGKRKEPPKDRKTLLEMISANSRVIVAKRKKTVTELKADLLKDYGVDDKAKLSDEQAQELFLKLEAML